jgi:mRNA interferase HigB
VDVITEAEVIAFMKAFPDAKTSIQLWLDKTQSAKWNSLADIKSTFPSVSYIPKNVYCFNIQGNNYRLETRISFTLEVVEILAFSSHAEYDKRNKKRQTGQL